MSIDIVSRVGYGFILEPLNDEDPLEALEKLEDDQNGMNRIKHLSIEIGGDMMSGENIQIVAFLKNPEPVYLGNHDYNAGVFGFSEEDTPELNDEIIQDLEIVRKYFHLVNRRPIVVASFSVS